MVQAVVILGVLINFAGTYTYIRDTLRGSTKPNRVTWFLWSIAPLIGAVAAFYGGVSWAVVPVLMTGLCPLLVFAASFWNSNAYWKLEKFDYACGAFSVLALILWAVTREPVIAIIFAIIADAFAALPTLFKSWTDPETETAFAYVAAGLSVIASFIVAPPSFIAYAFPVYLVVINGVMALVIILKRRYPHQSDGV